MLEPLFIEPPEFKSENPCPNHMSIVLSDGSCAFCDNWNFLMKELDKLVKKE